MDTNLTGPVAAQIADNLAKTSGDNTLTLAILSIIAAVIGAGGVLIGAYLTNRFSLTLEKWKLTVNEFQKKKDAFIELTGKKPLMRQHYITLGESKISQKYYAKILKIPELMQLKMIKDKIDPEEIFKDELNRWEEIEGNVTGEIASDNSSLYKILGTIQTSFPTVPIDLINDIQNANDKLNRKIEEIKDRIEKLPLDHLKENVKPEEVCWENTVKTELCDKIELLIIRLREEMAKERDPTL